MSDSSAQHDLHAKETEFHDNWAASVKLEDIRVREVFEAPAAMENRFILSQMGPLNGKRLLDVGAGLGESSVYFALQGADVTCTDISPGMVDCAVRLGVLHSVKITGSVMPGETLDLPAESFDLVYIANTIHHVADKETLFREIQKVLKPGGKFFSFDPLAYNPVIEVYRRMATAVRTDDEAPLTFAHVRLASKYFRNVRHREFWICSLVLFLKYYLVDRVHPNDDRYWKRIFRETPETLRWWLPLQSLDSVLTRIPIVRRLAWNMVMWGEKA